MMTQPANAVGENAPNSEMRLDNVLYRLYGASRPQARQLVMHGHDC